MARGYQIVDEPVPSGLSHLAVNPLFPWLSLAFVGVWWGAPWFALNALALGGRRRGRELLVALGFPLILFATLFAVAAIPGLFPALLPARQYLLLAIPFVRILLGYVLFMSQAETYALRKYFSPGEAPAWWRWGLVIGWFVSRRVSDWLEGSPILNLVLG